MKKLFLLAAVLFSIPVFSQSADERIGTVGLVRSGRKLSDLKRFHAG